MDRVDPWQGGTAAGWVYDETTGAISANLPAAEADAADLGLDPQLVADRLHLGDHDRSSALIQLLVAGIGIFERQLFGDSIVLTNPKCVHRRQRGVLVRSNVTGERQSIARAAGILKARLVVWQQTSGARCKHSAAECAQRIDSFLIGAIDDRSINERGDFIELLS